LKRISKIKESMIIKNKLRITCLIVRFLFTKCLKEKLNERKGNMYKRSNKDQKFKEIKLVL